MHSSATVYTEPVTVQVPSLGKGGGRS